MQKETNDGRSESGETEKWKAGGFGKMPEVRDEDVQDRRDVISV